MNFIFVLMLLTLSAGVWSKSVKVHYNLEEAETLFENFIAKHGKVYKSEEEKLMRREIFKRNLLEINRKNADPDDTAHYGITQFTDMTQTEFTASTSGLKFPSEGSSESNCIPTTLASSNFSQAPDEFDWRSKGVVTHVKNQFTCGSCWAFSSTGHLESQYAIKHNKMVLFSAQQLVDCVTSCRGCHGGLMSYAFGYVKDQGLMTEEAYPYKAKDLQCRAKPDQSAIKVTGCNTYNLQDEEELKELLSKKGPISVAVASGTWSAYTGGIFNKCRPEPLSHAVLLVAYGTENGTPYWSLKNSWGDHWGEEGYIRILRGSNECGLMNQYMATADVA